MTASSFPQSSAPTLAPGVDEHSMPPISDDECMERLARAVAEHDDRKLGEVAQLIGRLAVPIE